MNNFYTLIFLLYLSSLSVCVGQQANVDDLKVQLANASEDQKADILMELMWESRDLNPDDAIKYGEEILKITENSKTYSKRPKVLNLIGVACRNKGNYTLALDYYKQALLQADISNDTVQKGYAYINIGQLYHFQGNQYKALKNMKEALLVSNKINDLEMSGYCYMNLGDIQLSNGHYELALENYKRSLVVRDKTNNIQGRAATLKSIGDAYLAAGNPFYARNEFQRALKLSEDIDYNSIQYSCKAAIGDTYFYSSEDSLDDALRNYQEAYTGFVKLKSPLQQAKVLEKIAKVYLAQNRLTRAIQFADKGLKIAEDLPALQEALLLTSILSNAYEKRGDIHNQNKYLKKQLYYLYLYQDAEQARKTQMLENSIQMASKEKEIDELHQNNTLAKTKIKNQEYFIIAFFILLLLLGAVIYLINNKRKRIHEFSIKLKEKAKEINQQKVIIDQKAIEEHELNMQLVEKNKELENSLNQTQMMHKQLEKSEKLALVGQMMAVVAHEINNPTNFISNNITPISENLKEVFEIIKDQDVANKEEVLEDIEESILLLEGIEDGVKRIIEISSDLKNVVRNNNGHALPFNVNDNLENVTNLIYKKYKYDEIEVIKEYQSDLPEITCLGGKISQVFINLIDNAFQAVKENSTDIKTITINTELRKKNICISISDTGGGIKDADHLFEAFYTTKKEGLGIGLMICKRIVQKHNGSLGAFNNQKGGATFTVQLPLEYIEKND
ncbi:tetratricopeptide repeat protein [Flammeovirga kamogawensis]|uniref:histidine kinase n=1 Tax=Flammeovirga kamogawensis TaxID=373891 RepID=A0ABX8GV00_9BACT|nr:tetratricopeptide repeat protein [Flammeovirga kamogawensis]MBB6461663.1 signal transduction histidine kinase [Flammeovirga kamogawensis]QWG07411.1 tetratricopeptide repeat protein [Flammeovirga kamogawensis]TRX69222.1 tetratricopeptide repeat protein [Flammeovirga kamogawensis]